MQPMLASNLQTSCFCHMQGVTVNKIVKPKGMLLTHLRMNIPRPLITISLLRVKICTA